MKLFRREDPDLVTKDEFEHHIEDEVMERKKLSARIQALSIEVNNMSGGKLTMLENKRKAK